MTLAHRGVGVPQLTAASGDAVQLPTSRRVAMNWARRLKRVFGIEVKECALRGGGDLKSSPHLDLDDEVLCGGMPQRLQRSLIPLA